MIRLMGARSWASKFPKMKHDGHEMMKGTVILLTIPGPNKRHIAGIIGPRQIGRQKNVRG